jgi:hypothetical protein
LQRIKTAGNQNHTASLLPTWRRQGLRRRRLLVIDLDYPSHRARSSQRCGLFAVVLAAARAGRALYAAGYRISLLYLVLSNWPAHSATLGTRGQSGPSPHGVTVGNEARAASASGRRKARSGRRHGRLHAGGGRPTIYRPRPDRAVRAAHLRQRGALAAAAPAAAECPLARERANAAIRMGRHLPT